MNTISQVKRNFKKVYNEYVENNKSINSNDKNDILNRLGIKLYIYDLYRKKWMKRSLRV